MASFTISRGLLLKATSISVEDLLLVEWERGNKTIASRKLQLNSDVYSRFFGSFYFLLEDPNGGYAMYKWFE